MATKASRSVSMTKAKDTKNTIQFSEDVPDTEYPAFRTLYISKPEFAKLGSPEKITVTVEAQ